MTWGQLIPASRVVVRGGRYLVRWYDGKIDTWAYGPLSRKYMDDLTADELRDEDHEKLLELNALELAELQRRAKDE